MSTDWFPGKKKRKKKEDLEEIFIHNENLKLWY